MNEESEYWPVGREGVEATGPSGRQVRASQRRAVFIHSPASALPRSEPHRGGEVSIEEEWLFLKHWQPVSFGALRVREATQDSWQVSPKCPALSVPSGYEDKSLQLKKHRSKWA